MTAENASPDSTGGGRSRTLWLALAGVVLLAGVAVGAFFWGKSAADAPGARQEGRAQGIRLARAQYEPGRPRYQQIFAAGRAQGLRIGRQAGQRAGEQVGERQGEQAGQRRGEQAGERVGFTRGQLAGEREGFERGERQGELQGNRAGIASGARAAVGGFPSWNPAALYVVTVQPDGQRGVPWRINSRQDLQRGKAYRSCAQNPEELCSIRLPSG